MQMAYLVSQESKCASWKVGAVIEKNGVILGTGYNGTTSGQDHCTDVGLNRGWGVKVDGQFVFDSEEDRVLHSTWSDRNEVHAEQNAIFFAARHGNTGLDGAKMYVTLSPCPRCVNAIIQSGISTLIYCEEYDRNEPDWANSLILAGIKVVKLNKSMLKLINWEKVNNEPKINLK